MADYIINLKNPEDSPEKIAEKLNKLTYAIDASVIRGIPSIEQVDRLTQNFHKYVNGERQRIDNNDLRWHGAGLSSVSHDGTLSGLGTSSSPLSVVSGATAGYQSPTGTVNGSNKVFVFGSAPNAIVVDGVSLRKTQSDASVNWTGTTTITLAVAPNFDIYGVA